MLAKFRSKIGVDTAARNINEIKEVEKELALRPRNSSESLFPIILGIFGLLIMLQVYIF